MLNNNIDPAGLADMLNLPIWISITSSSTAYSAYLSRYAFFFNQNPNQNKINTFVWLFSIIYFFTDFFFFFLG